MVAETTSESSSEEEPPRRYPTGERHEPEWYGDPLSHFCGDQREPTSLSEAFKAPDAKQWANAMQMELDVFEVKNKWIFKLKRDTDGNICRYRAR